jgi:hypothetical protein
MKYYAKSGNTELILNTDMAKPEEQEKIARNIGKIAYYHYRKKAMEQIQAERNGNTTA